MVRFSAERSVAATTTITIFLPLLRAFNQSRSASMHRRKSLFFGQRFLQETRQPTPTVAKRALAHANTNPIADRRCLDGMKPPLCVVATVCAAGFVQAAQTIRSSQQTLKDKGVVFGLVCWGRSAESAASSP